MEEITRSPLDMETFPFSFWYIYKYCIHKQHLQQKTWNPSKPKPPCPEYLSKTQRKCKKQLRPRSPEKRAEDQKKSFYLRYFLTLEHVVHTVEDVQGCIWYIEFSAGSDFQHPKMPSFPLHVSVVTIHSASWISIYTNFLGNEVLLGFLTEFV